MRFGSYSTLITLLIGVGGCVAISPYDLFPLVASSPTPLACSLQEIASRVVSPQLSATEQKIEVTGIRWIQYEDDRLGYSFEYPAAYSDPTNQVCTLTVVNRVDQGQEVYIGSSAAIYARQLQHASWQDDACLLAFDTNQVAQLTRLENVSFADEQALAIGFSATWNSDGREIIFQHDGLLFILSNIANPTCNTIEGTLIETNTVYQQMVDTFRFQHR